MKSLEKIKSKMQILAVILVVGVILVSSNVSAINNQNLSENVQSDKKSVGSFDFSDTNEIIISYRLQELNQKQIVCEQGIFTRMEIPGAGFLGELGRPRLPYVSQLIAVPSTQVSIEIIGASVMESRVVGKVYPTQKPQKDSADYEMEDFVIDDAFYTSDRDYPSCLAHIAYQGKIRDISFVRIGIFPIHYNPKTEIATIYDEITVKILFEETVVPVESNFEHAPFHKFYKAIFSNWNEFIEQVEFIESNSGSHHDRPELGCDYLIITHPDFQDAANDLADWKNKRGIITKVVDTTETGSTEGEIKQYIQTAYDTWDPRPSYLLLFGDDEYVTTTYDIGIPSDIHYVCIAGDDYFPDMFIGRIPVDTIDEANIILQKIFDYEKTPPINPWFYNNVTVAAYFQDGWPYSGVQDGYEDRMFINTSEVIRDYLLTQGYEVERVYCTEDWIIPTNYNDGEYGDGEPLPPELLRENGFAWDGDHVDITDAINQGSFLVTHRDHGGSDRWCDPEYTINNIENDLSNNELLPVVFSINCLTGKFYYGDCFCEEFLRKADGGAVGIIGATGTTYSGWNDYMCRGFYDAIWPNFDPDQGDDTSFYRMGEVINYGKIYMSITWPWTEHSCGGHVLPQHCEEIAVARFHWFGDPTMEIWTDVPQNLVVDHPAAVYGPGNVIITVTDGDGSPVEEAFVCMSQENGIYVRGVTDSSGVTVLDLSSLTEDEDINLVVTKHNFVPYEITIQVMIPGDTDHDGDVDIADLAQLLGHYGTESGATWEMGDFDGDGDVDLADLAELLGNYGYPN